MLILKAKPVMEEKISFHEWRDKCKALWAFAAASTFFYCLAIHFPETFGRETNNGQFFAQSVVSTKTSHITNQNHLNSERFKKDTELPNT